MLSKLLNKKKNGFTLIELLLVCSAFAILVSGVIIAINRAYSFMNDTKLRIKAANFAREGVEIIFNIRDTNWRRHSGERDAHRLNTTFTGENKFEEGLYVLKEGVIGSGDKYFYADKLTSFSSAADYEEYYKDETFRNNIELYTGAEMKFNGDYNYMEFSGGVWVSQTGSIQDILFNETDFYRLVRIFGIYKKDVMDTNVPATRTEVASGIPAEMRFCVKVFYTNNATRSSSELCSITTNFME